MTDFWQGRRVAVTGAAGFVGSTLCRALVDRGASVLGLDTRVIDPPCWRVHGLTGQAELVRADLFNGANLRYHLDPFPSAGDRRRTEVVFHLAGVSHIHEAQGSAVRAFEVNTRAAWVLLDVCGQMDVQAVVLASSNHVYGSANPRHRVLLDGVDDFTEMSATEQTDAYGTSKACQDLVARCFGAMGVPVATLRHVNTYGPADPHVSHLVTGAILSVLRGEAPVIRSDGTPVKAYLHVGDVVDAYLLLAERLAAQSTLPPPNLSTGVGIMTADARLAGKPFNCAPRAPISALALVDTVIQAAGLDLVPEITGEDLSQSGYVEMLDAGRLRALGWAPRWSLEDGIADTLAWYRAHGGMKWLES